MGEVGKEGGREDLYLLADFVIFMSCKYLCATLAFLV